MTNASSEAPLPKHDSLAALRQPNFNLYLASRIFASIGQALFQTVLAWQVYDISGSAVSLGLLGLVRFVPALATSLIGGAVADTYNRRYVILIALLVPLAAGVVLTLATLGGTERLEIIYIAVFSIGFASAFEQPARSALLPAIVRPDTFGNAVTVQTTVGSVSQACGPLLGGVVIAFAGPSLGYGVFVACTVAAMVPIALIRYNPAQAGPRRAISIATVKEGIVYVKERQVLLGAMSLDMFAVIFGGAAALLPIYAKDILHVGGIGFGVLSASMPVGAFITSFILVTRPQVRRTGRTLVFAVALFGLATIAFGFSRIFALSVLFYGLTGAADQLSLVMRHTTIQLTTPDELRGRVSAVNQVFVGASTQVGAMESGFVAAVTTATFAVVSGGFAAVAVAAFVALRLKELYNYEIPRVAQTASKAAEPASEADGHPAAPLVEEPASAAGS